MTYDAAFASLNAVMLAYALDRFVGADVMLNDLRAAMFGNVATTGGGDSGGFPDNGADGGGETLSARTSQ